MKQRVWGISALVVMVLLAVAVGYAPPVQAATPGFNIVTSPLPIKLSTDPGRTVETELRVKNQNPEPETIKVGLMKFGAQGELGEPNLFDLTSKDTYANWVTFSPSQFVAPPGTWMTVKMTIKVPSDAALGYYMAVTFSRATPQKTSKGSSVHGSAATLVLLDVKNPNAKRKLQLVSFTSDHKLYEYLPANFTIKVRNKGNIYLAPSGNIFISKGNKPVATLDFNGVGGSVLPASNRVYTLPWDSGFPKYSQKLVNGKPVNDSKARPKLDLKWNFGDASKFRFGKYTAKLFVVYDNGQQDVPLESTLTFWVLPWKLMIVGVILLLLIFYAIWMLLIRPIVAKAKQGVNKRRGRA
jgi:hypothetical protein